MEENDLPWFIRHPEAALESYTSGRKLVCLDLETSNLDKGSALNPDNHIILACWKVVDADGTAESKHHWGDEYDQAELETDILSADFIVAHNAKFEMQWLKRMGMELRDILCYDTMLGEWVRAGNRGGQAGWELNLDDTAKRYGLKGKAPIPSMMLKMGISTADIPVEYLLPYCHDDVEQCYGVYLQQRELLHEDKLLHLALARNLCCAALADIEFNGAELDAARVEEEYNKSIEEFRQLDDQLAAMCGGINLSSPKQLGEFLYDVLGFVVPKDHYGKELKTAKGLPKTDVKTLDKLVASSDKQREFLSLYKRRNKLDSLITKNLDFFRLICEQKAGKFYGNLNQGFTQTHRLAATGRPILFDGQKKPKGIQYQNLPRQYKRLFTAHNPDEECLEFDAAQLEFRVAADLGHDAVATEEIITGFDVHSYTASVLTAAGEPTSRQDAKASSFAPLYGGGGSTPAQKEYAIAFKEKYSGISSTQKEWTMEVLDCGKLRTPYGMVFHWPGTRMNGKGYVDNTTSIYNFPVQGFATAEIIPVALTYFWQRSKHLRCSVFNTIHDSICARVNKEDMQEAKDLAKQSMTYDVYKFLEDVYDYRFTVPLGIGLKVAKHWSDTKEEEVVDVWPDGREVVKNK